MSYPKKGPVLNTGTQMGKERREQLKNMLITKFKLKYCSRRDEEGELFITREVSQFLTEKTLTEANLKRLDEKLYKIFSAQDQEEPQAGMPQSSQSQRSNVSKQSAVSKQSHQSHQSLQSKQSQKSERADRPPTTSTVNEVDVWGKISAYNRNMFEQEEEKTKQRKKDMQAQMKKELDRQMREKTEKKKRMKEEEFHYEKMHFQQIDQFHQSESDNKRNAKEKAAAERARIHKELSGTLKSLNLPLSLFLPIYSDYAYLT
jgi:hypothetical protein